MSTAILFPDAPASLPPPIDAGDVDTPTRNAARSCPTCGHTIVTAADATGAVHQLDTAGATWLLDWTRGTDAPKAIRSRAYPEHQCDTGISLHCSRL